MNLSSSPFKRSHQRGATMIEVMVAVLVFSVGLLGVAATQTLGLTNTQSALNRSYSSQLAYELVDIMRINRVVADGSTTDIFSNLDTTVTSVVYATTDGCEAQNTTCTATELAKHQLSLWITRVGDLLPSSTAVVSLSGSTYSLTLTWLDMKDQDEIAGNGGTGTASFTTSFQL